MAESKSSDKDDASKKDDASESGGGPPPPSKMISFEDAKAERMRQITADAPAEAGVEPVEDVRNFARIILLPMTNDGEIDTLGVNMAGFASVDVVGNYRDVAKVRVTGPSKDVANLQKRSQQYFNEKWIPAGG